jgi:nucleoside-diphosphate-sugar epimerase
MNSTLRVLLTGASGFIGRQVLRQLQDAGIDTVVAGRSRPEGYTGYFIEADLLEIDSANIIVQNAKASHLVHLAWYAEHVQYWTSTLNFRWVDASVRLVESFCAAGGSKIVAAGSCAEYDWTFNICHEDHTPLNPATLYGAAKDATRRLLEAVCRNHSASLVWARVFAAYGLGEDSRRLIPALVEVFQGNKPPFGVNANSYRDFLNVNDVANGFLHLITSNATGTFNIASGQPIQISNMVEAIANSFQRDPRIILDLSTERPGEPEILIGSNQKLKELGWKPTVSITEYIRNTIECSKNTKSIV